MDLCRVRYFLAVCEHGSFSAAAEACGVSQPSVTMGVRRLEQALGGRLFERRRPVRLTPLGVRLRPAFETLNTAAETVMAIASQKDGLPAGVDVPLAGGATRPEARATRDAGDVLFGATHDPLPGE
jgi:DNA-binding transcriptional LysR family regulator